MERKTIDAHTRTELAEYGVDKGQIEVTNRPLANMRWYRVECEQTRTERCETTVLASNAHEARRRAHWNEGADTFSPWQDTQADESTFATRRIIPFAMAYTASNDALDDPPKRYLEPH